MAKTQKEKIMGKIDKMEAKSYEMKGRAEQKMKDLRQDQNR